MGHRTYGHVRDASVGVRLLARLPVVYLQGGGEGGTGGAAGAPKVAFIVNDGIYLSRPNECDIMYPFDRNHLLRSLFSSPLSA
jgi:hypothetical protein